LGGGDFNVLPAGLRAGKKEAFNQAQKGKSRVATSHRQEKEGTRCSGRGGKSSIKKSLTKILTKKEEQLHAGPTAPEGGE